MKQAIVPSLVLLSTLLLGQAPRDLGQQLVAFRLIGKWNAHLHFENTPPEIPKDFYGTVEAKQALGMRVEAIVHVNPLPGGRPLEARGIFEDDKGVDLSGKFSEEEVRSVLFLAGSRGYLPMNGSYQNGRLVLQGDRVPEDPNGGTWRVSVEFKDQDEIDIWLLDAKADPKVADGKLGYIKLTRMKG